MRPVIVSAECESCQNRTDHGPASRNLASCPALIAEATPPRNPPDAKTLLKSKSESSRSSPVDSKSSAACCRRACCRRCHQTQSRVEIPSPSMNTRLDTGTVSAGNISACQARIPWRSCSVAGTHYHTPFPCLHCRPPCPCLWGMPCRRSLPRLRGGAGIRRMAMCCKVSYSGTGAATAYRRSFSPQSILRTVSRLSHRRLSTLG